MPDDTLKQRAREAAERIVASGTLERARTLGNTAVMVGELTQALLDFARPLEALAARFAHEAVLHLSGNPASRLAQMVEDGEGHALEWLQRLTTAERELDALREAIEKWGRSKGWAYDHPLYDAARSREGGGGD